MRAASVSFLWRNSTVTIVHKPSTNIARSAARNEAGNIEKNAGIRKKEKKHLVITEIEDSFLRMELILRALGEIRASIRRKRKKIQESEFRDFDKNNFSV